MNKLILATAAAAFALNINTACAFDFSSLLGSDEPATEASAQPSAQTGSNSQTNALSDGLLSLISSQLGVSKTQAAGGVGVLMGYASNQLPPEYAEQLNALLPGFENQQGASLTSSLLGMVKDMDGVESSFQALGMDSSMIDQFAPLIESYLGDQGADAGLLSALGDLWS